MIAAVSNRLDRASWARAADMLVVGIAVSLPWSVSATYILIGLWLVALIPTLDGRGLREALSMPAGVLPILLWVLGAVGMLWADASWPERLAGLDSFHRLLAIPLLLTQFRRSDRGMSVVMGFLCSCVALLAVSWTLFLLPEPLWRGKLPGVPVKDTIVQSGLFTLCIIVLVDAALDLWRRRRRRLAFSMLVLAGAFLADMVFVANSRTALLVLLLLLIVFAVRRLDWKGMITMAAAAATLSMLLWASSPYLRFRVNALVQGIGESGLSDSQTSPGQRMEFWRKSLAFIVDAPVIGHGTGSIKKIFREERAREGSSLVIDNPHNQTFAVALQIGLLGTAVLYAMWLAHLLLFRGEGLAAWIGLVILLQNVIGSLFNSHLFDFTPGWLYVFGVGIAGGMVLRGVGPPSTRPRGDVVAAKA